MKKLSLSIILIFCFASITQANSNFVLIQKSFQGSLCGGVVIKDNMILTFKSCVLGKSTIFAKNPQNAESSELHYYDSSAIGGPFVLMQSEKNLVNAEITLGPAPQIGDVVTTFSSETYKKVTIIIQKPEPKTFFESLFSADDMEEHIYLNSPHDLLPGAPIFNALNQLVGIVPEQVNSGRLLHISEEILSIANKIERPHSLLKAPLNFQLHPVLEVIRIGHNAKYECDAGLGIKATYNDHYYFQHKMTFVKHYHGNYIGYSDFFGKNHFDDKPWVWSVGYGRRFYTGKSKYAGVTFNELALSFHKDWFAFGVNILFGDRPADGIQILSAQ